MLGKTGLLAMETTNVPLEESTGAFTGTDELDAANKQLWDSIANIIDFQRSNLSNWLALQLKQLHVLPPMAMLFLICVMTAILSEAVTSSSSTILLLPVAFELAKIIEVHPLYIMMPLTLSSSFSFMLPVGSPSCALVYNAGDMKVIDLIKPGIFLNIMCCGIQVVSMNTLGHLIFDLSVIKANDLNTTDIYTQETVNMSTF